MGRLLCALALPVALLALMGRGSEPPRRHGARLGGPDSDTPLSSRPMLPDPTPSPPLGAPSIVRCDVEGGESVCADPRDGGWLHPERVTFLDAASKIPVEGVRAWVIRFDRSTGERRGVREAISDEQGEALLPPAFPSLVALLARKRGYVQCLQWLDRGDVPANVELSPGVPLRGLVLLPGDRPAAAATVYAWDAATDEEVLCDFRRIDSCDERGVETDAEGRFEIDGIGPDRPLVLAVLLEGHGAYRAIHGAQSDLVLRLGEGGTLEGRVFDAQGMPLAAADVYVESEAEDGDYDFGIITSSVTNARAVTDSAGRYRITGISPAGRYVASASMDYWSRGVSAPVDLSGPDDRQWRDVVVERCASLRVRLVDPPDGKAWFDCALHHLDGSSSWSRFWSNSSVVSDFVWSRHGIHAGTYLLSVRVDRRTIERRVIDLPAGQALDLSIPFPGDR